MMTKYVCKACSKEFEAEEAAPNGIIKCPHCNVAVTGSEPEAELPAGYMLGAFEIVKLLGRGGMGNVYLALQVSMQRHVALKVLPKAMTRDSASVMKFLNEVKNSGRLQHPHIVVAIDAGEDNGTYFLAMQYVDGETLEALIDREGKLSAADALDYALMIGEALKYAWDRQGIFHKDIKPGNIMIDRETEDAFLLDMGISQKIGESDSHSDGNIEGSPFYMSPEQSRGEKLDWTTDLYSLGATIYHAIVGVPPYDNHDILRIVEMHSTEPFPEPSVRNPEAKVAPSVVKLLKRMLAKKPAERFKSWAEFLKECKSVRKELGAKGPKRKIIKSKTGSYKPQIQPKKSSSPLVMVNVALFLALLGVGAFFGYGYLNSSNARKSLAKAEDYVSRPGFAYDGALSLYADAKEKASAMGVSEELRKRVGDGYSAIKAAADRRAQEQEAFESAMKNATVVFSQAKSVYLQAREAFRVKQDDGGLFLKSLEEAKNAFKIASAISTDDAKELQRLDLFKDAIGTLIKQLEGELARKARIAAESAAKAQESKDAAENAAKAAEAAKSAAAAKAAEAASKLESYKKELVKRKDELRLLFVLASRKRDFDRIREALSGPKEASGLADSSLEARREALAFDVWTKGMVERVDRAAKVWSAICSSGKKFAGKLFTVNGKSATISSIDGESLIYSNGKERVSISDLSPTDLQTLLRRLLPQDASADAFAFLMGDGDFEEAASFVPDDESKKELSAVTKVYLRARLKKALRDREDGKADALEKVKRDFGSLPEYPEIEKELGASASR